MLLYGAHWYVGPGAELGASVEALMVGFWAVLLVTAAFNLMGEFVFDQVGVGTLEHLYLSPFGMDWLTVSKMVATFLLTVLRTVPFLLLMMLTTGRWLQVSPLSTLPLLILLAAQGYGLGLALGGLALIVKRVGAMNQVVSALIVGLAAAPPDWSPLIRYLPFNTAWRQLRLVMSEGLTLAGLDPLDLGLVAVQALFLLAAGWFVYRAGERAARREGLLGRY